MDEFFSKSQDNDEQRRNFELYHYNGIKRSNESNKVPIESITQKWYCLSIQEFIVDMKRFYEFMLKNLALSTVIRLWHHKHAIITLCAQMPFYHQKGQCEEFLW